jgi:hypothetical protein
MNSVGSVVATIVLAIAVAGFLIWGAFEIGVRYGTEGHCPVAKECPPPVVDTTLPTNCGRIGSRKVVCLRNETDRLRFGVETTNDEPYSPIIFMKSEPTVDGGAK